MLPTRHGSKPSLSFTLSRLAWIANAKHRRHRGQIRPPHVFVSRTNNRTQALMIFPTGAFTSAIALRVSTTNDA